MSGRSFMQRRTNVKEVRLVKRISVPVGKAEDGQSVELEASALVWRAHEEGKWTQQELNEQIQDARNIISDVLYDELKALGKIGEATELVRHAREQMNVYGL